MKYNNIITHSRSGKPIAARDKKKDLNKFLKRAREKKEEIKQQDQRDYQELNNGKFKR